MEEKRNPEEVVGLTERTKELEGEVTLRDEVKALKDKILQEFLLQHGNVTSARLSEENKLDEECASCEDEDLLLNRLPRWKTKNPEKLGMLEAYLEHQTFYEFFVTVSDSNFSYLGYFSYLSLRFPFTSQHRSYIARSGSYACGTTTRS